MAEEKQESTKPVPEDPLVTILKGLQQGQAQINANVQQLGKNDSALETRINNMEKNPPKKDIMEQITTVFNMLDKTGVLEMVKGAISGGGEEPTGTPENLIPPEDYAAYIDFRKGTMSNLLATQKAQLDSVLIENAERRKKIGADF